MESAENAANMLTSFASNRARTGEELKAEGKPTDLVTEATQSEPPLAKAPDISIHEAAGTGDIEAVKQHLAAGTDVNAESMIELTF